jgi:hypothetical protein
MKLTPQVPLFKLVSVALIQNPTGGYWVQGLRRRSALVRRTSSSHACCRGATRRTRLIIFDALVREKRVLVTVTALTLDEYNALVRERGVHEAVSLE